MSRKRPRHDSLELFLDTICNMFGGFIFLMLFVVVSIRATSDSVVERMRGENLEISRAQVEELELELQSLQDRREKLVEDAQKVKEFLDDLNDPKTAEIYKETLEKLDELKRINESNEAAARKIAEIDERAQETEAERKSAREQIETAEKETAQAQEALADAKRTQARRMSAPQMRDSYKNEIAVVLKFGRLYFWHKFEGRSTSGELNTDDFVVVEDTPSEMRTEPKAWRGLDLAGEDVEEALTKAFAPFDPKRDKVSIVVASDSYEEFAVARDFLKKNGYDVRPIVGKEGTFVADRGGTNQKAQ